jgi:hypothetical protein
MPQLGKGNRKERIHAVRWTKAEWRKMLAAVKHTAEGSGHGINVGAFIRRVTMREVDQILNGKNPAPAVVSASPRHQTEASLPQ